jgi:hypothetical protein
VGAAPVVLGISVDKLDGVEDDMTDRSGRASDRLSDRECPRRTAAPRTSAMFFDELEAGRYVSRAVITDFGQ